MCAAALDSSPGHVLCVCFSVSVSGVCFCLLCSLLGYAVCYARSMSAGVLSSCRFAVCRAAAVVLTDICSWHRMLLLCCSYHAMLRLFPSKLGVWSCHAVALHVLYTTALSAWSLCRHNSATRSKCTCFCVCTSLACGRGPFVQRIHSIVHFASLQLPADTLESFPETRVPAVLNASRPTVHNNTHTHLKHHHPVFTSTCVLTLSLLRTCTQCMLCLL
jgi:hypothetical protein